METIGLDLGALFSNLGGRGIWGSPMKQWDAVSSSL